MFEYAWTYLNTFRPVSTCFTISLPVYGLPVPAFLKIFEHIWTYLNIFGSRTDSRHGDFKLLRTVENCWELLRTVWTKNYWLYITDYKSHIISYKSQITNHKSQVTDHALISHFVLNTSRKFFKTKIMITCYNQKEVSCDIYAITIETISYFNELNDHLYENRIDKTHSMIQNERYETRWMWTE
jgi:hypothetical protein